MTHDAVEAGRDVPVRRGEVRRILPQNRRDRLGRRVAVEGAASRQHLVEDRAEGEQIRPLVGRVSFHLLGRHVAERPHHDAGLGAGRRCRQVRLLPARPFGLRELRETEIEDLDPPVPRQEQVLGLQVPVADSLFVRRREALGDLHGVFDRLADSESSAREPRAERLALEQLGHDVWRAVVRAEVVDGRDVRVVQRPGRLRLELEAAEAVRVLRVRGRKDLDRDVALKPLVARAINLSHSSRPEWREDLVGAETGAGGQRHGSLTRFYPWRGSLTGRLSCKFL